MSTSAGTVDGGPPIVDAVAQIHGVLDALTHAPAWSLSEEEARSTLVALTRAAARVVELKLRVAAHAETARVGEETGATSMASWWAHVTRQTRAEAHRKTRLATALASNEPTRSAMAVGAVVSEQAWVIAEALDALPTDVADEATRVKAEEVLLGYAEVHDAKALGSRGLGAWPRPWWSPSASRPSPEGSPPGPSTPEP